MTVIVSSLHVAAMVSVFIVFTNTHRVFEQVKTTQIRYELKVVLLSVCLCFACLDTKITHFYGSVIRFLCILD